MKRTLLLTLALLTFTAAYSQITSQKEATLDSFLTNLDTYQKFMGSLTIYKNGEVLYDKQVGEVKLEKEDWQANNETKYRIGSITKMYTSVMVMQLVNEGKLSLDTKLSKFYPQIPNADEITIRQMLNHHSGIYSVTSDEKYLQWSTKPTTKKEIINKIVKAESVFKPGEKGQYSNSNFILLGYIIEDIEGKPYTEVLKTRINDKLGLVNTSFGTSHKKDNKEAPSFIITDDKWLVFQETDMSVPQGAGAMVSTTKEMSMFIDGLFKGKLLPKAWLDTMTTMDGQFGLGIFQFPLFEMKTYGHTGGIDAFSSMLSYNINDSMVVAFSSNGLNYDMNSIMIDVAKVIYDRGFVMPDLAVKTITKEEVEKYEGEYSSDQLPLSLTIFYENGKLKALGSGKGQAAFVVEKTEEGVFEFASAKITMVFKDEEDGKCQTMVFTQMGQTYIFKRNK